LFFGEGEGGFLIVYFFHLNVNSSLVNKKGEKDYSFFFFVYDNDIFHMFKETFSYSTHLEKFSINIPSLSGVIYLDLF